LEKVLPLLDNEQLCFAYTGPAVEKGVMDALLFSNSLKGLVQLLESSNQVLNGDALLVDIEIYAEFHEGSFEFFIKIKEKIGEVANDILNPKDIVHATYILALLGLGIPLIQGGVSLIDALTATKQSELKIIDTSDNKNIIIECDGKKISIPIEVFLLSQDLHVRKGLEEFVQPLCSTGIEGIEARKDKKTIKRIERKQAPYLRTPDIYKELNRENYRAILTIDAPRMLGGDIWRFRDSNRREGYSAKITDKEFLNEVFGQRVLAFKSGDRLEVDITRKDIETKKGQERRYEISKVHRHISVDDNSI
jgi:hypothetical protein